ncbi:MAG: hypothetical protein WD751_10540 [Anaerolineales bacterium]
MTGKIAYLSVVVLVLLAACAPAVPSTPTGPYLPEGQIFFENYAKVKFVGTAYGHGDTAIILANMGQGGQSQWDPFVEAVDKDKFTVITFSYAKPDDYSEARQDAGFVFDAVREAGFVRVICIGASLGITACANLGHKEEIIGLALVAGPNMGPGLSGEYPKLFIAGAVDHWSDELEAIYESAAEPKTLILYEGIARHGTDMFHSQVKEQFLQDLLDFVNRF